MKRNLLLILIICVLTFGLSSLVHAVPIDLPAGPVWFDFVNREQVSVAGAIAPPGGGALEANWGIAFVNTLQNGFVTEPRANIEDDTTRGPLFTGGSSQITGMFYGIEFESFNPMTQQLRTKSGFLDLYWDEPGLAGGGTIVNVASLLPSDRTAVDKFTGVTDGQFLARLAFASDIDPSNSDVTILGSSAGFPDSISGISSAESYANLVLGAVNWQGTTGFWDPDLDTDWFLNQPLASGGGLLPFGTRDVRFRNTFSALASWSGVAPDGSPILGADSTDPATTFAVPEPGTFMLLGSSLLGLGFFSRRVRRK
jgi:hypothetical protein